MAFVDLTEDQIGLVLAVVEASESNLYRKEFYYGRHNPSSLTGWKLQGGIHEPIIKHVSESDIRIAEDEGYLLIHSSKGQIEWIALKKKAFDETAKYKITGSDS